MIKENKVTKYLLYAFGEIILVIIGILIALNLNLRSEQRKVEAKIDLKLSNNLYDLAKNIDFAELCITSEAQVFHANKNEQERI